MKHLARAVSFAFAVSLAPICAGSASAQAPVLPRVSPSEQMIEGANSALRAQALRQQQENRLQFELNELREQRIRQEVFPRLTGPNVGAPCLPAAPAC
jgi:hypothetical protein